jgi:hypothetical protein
MLPDDRVALEVKSIEIAVEEKGVVTWVWKVP